MYLSGFVKKRVVNAWLRFLMDHPLYKIYNIQVDWSKHDQCYNTGASTSNGDTAVSERRRDEDVGENEGLECLNLGFC